MNQAMPMGADISKASVDTQVGIQSDKRMRVHITNDLSGFEELQGWLEKQEIQQVHVCLESTGTYSDAFAHFMHAHGHVVSILNPARVVAFRKSEGMVSKTDQLDALLLARFCAQKRPAAWQPAPAIIERVDQYMKRIEDIQSMLQQEKNRLENQRLDAFLQEQIKDHIALLTKQKEHMLCVVTQHIKQEAQEEREAKAGEETQATQPSSADAPEKAAAWVYEQFQLVDSIPGFAALSSWRAVCLIGVVERFASAKQVVKYVGIVATQRQSGTSVRGKSLMSRVGDPHARKWLYMCALTARHHDPDMKQWADELEAKGKAKKVVLVAVMRKLVHILYGVLKSGKSYDPRKAFPSHYPNYPQGQEMQEAA